MVHEHAHITEKPKVDIFPYDPETLRNDIKRSFEKLGWKKRFKSDTKVFVKPNFTLPFFKPGVTTNGNVIEAVLGVLRDRVSEVYVGESDGGYASFTAEYSLKNHGMPEICKRTGTIMVNLSKLERTRIREKINGKNIEVTLPKFLLSIDETVSIPVLKVHVVVKASLSLKNLWGCHPDTLRILDHTNLEEKLVLIAKKIHLNYVVIDAIYGLNRRGPMDGDVMDVGAILVGNNPVATDSVAIRLMGFDPKNIRYIRVAKKEGLGPYEEEKIELLADFSQYQQHFYLQPTFVDRLGALTFKSYLLTKLVYDSPLTYPIYRILGKTPKKKILKPGDEV